MLHLTPTSLISLEPPPEERKVIGHQFSSSIYLIRMFPSKRIYWLKSKSTLYTSLYIHTYSQQLTYPNYNKFVELSGYFLLYIAIILSTIWSSYYCDIFIWFHYVMSFFKTFFWCRNGSYFCRSAVSWINITKNLFITYYITFWNLTPDALKLNMGRYL